MINQAWAEGKRVIVPVVTSGSKDLAHIEITSEMELRPGIFGLLQPEENNLIPTDPARASLIIVPGIAFDLRGHRIGYGRGYYDRLLSDMPCLKLGLAYDFQLVESLPARKDDIPVDLVITETRVVEASRS